MSNEARALETEQYERVNGLVLSRITGPLTFDIYLQLGPQKFTKIFNKGTVIELARLEGYILKGSQSFYIPKTQNAAFLKITSQMLERYRAQDFDLPEAQLVLDETADKVLGDIFSSLKLTEENLAHSRAVIRSYVEITKPNSKATPAVLKLAKSKPHLVRHSIMSALFAALLARAWSPADPKLWNMASLAAFLHDVSLGQTNENIEEHDKQLHANIQKEIHKHSDETAEILEASSLQPEVIQAILSHHENWDGTGYPKMLAKEQIPLIARIVSISEQFASLINDSPSGPAVAPQIAFRLLQKSSKVDPQLCETLGKLLHFT